MEPGIVFENASFKMVSLLVHAMQRHEPSISKHTTWKDVRKTKTEFNALILNTHSIEIFDLVYDKAKAEAKLILQCDQVDTNTCLPFIIHWHDHSAFCNFYENILNRNCWSGM